MVDAEYSFVRLLISGMIPVCGRVLRIIILKIQNINFFKLKEYKTDQGEKFCA